MIEKEISPQAGPSSVQVEPSTMASTAPKLTSVKPQLRCQSDGKLQKAIQSLAAVAVHNFMSKTSDASASASISDVSEVEVMPVTPIKHVKKAMVGLGNIVALQGVILVAFDSNKHISSMAAKAKKITCQSQNQRCAPVTCVVKPKFRPRLRQRLSVQKLLYLKFCKKQIHFFYLVYALNV